jgi:uncharacterized GH25 family protein
MMLPRKTLLVTGLALVLTGALAAHDLFLKLDSYFLAPNTAVRVPLLNGTFSTSENSIDRNRIAAINLAGPGGTTALDTTALTARNDTSFVAIRTGAEGTYLLGVSTLARDIALTGEQFAGYLKEEGLDDLVAERERTGKAATPATERYAKHVKAIFQVGAARSDGWANPLGYPAELVPLTNPYELQRGGTFRVRCLVDGQPAAGVVVLAGGRNRAGGRLPAIRVRSGADGVAEIPVQAAGRWYVKFIRIRESAQAGLTHESQWATLTFELR